MQVLKNIGGKNRQCNMMDHIVNMMAYHPAYQEHFLRTHSVILQGDGPLSYKYRNIIAIMAAGRHQCFCLMNHYKNEFLRVRGDPNWLKNSKAIPRKLQKLNQINKILAHRPWLLNKTLIEDLTKGDDSWSLSELMHAIVLLVHFHALSTFIFSCGINEKLNYIMKRGCNCVLRNIEISENNEQRLSIHRPVPCSPKKEGIQVSASPPSIVGEQEVKVETLVERMRCLVKAKSESPEIPPEELSKRFQTVEQQSAELTVAPQRIKPALDEDIELFIDDLDFIYQDFQKRGHLSLAPTFRVQDYSWEGHGCSLVNSLYNEVGNLLDKKFKTAYNLTYHTMGEVNAVDTSSFRQAIWYYIHCLYGIRHDDYDYNEVNQLLERSLKTFIKNAACYPERVTRNDYDRVMNELQQSEKVHLNLMLLEARMQAELLYALRSIARFMT